VNARDVRRVLAEQAAGFPVSVDPWQLAGELLTECERLHAQLRLVPGDLWSVFAETAEQNARWDAEQGGGR
jgi:hypothetical protein